jgi:hypothetical protein
MKNKYKIFIWCLWGFAIINLLILFRDNGISSELEQSFFFKVYSLLVAIAIIISFLQTLIWDIKEIGWIALLRIGSAGKVIVLVAACYALFSVVKGCHF